VLCCGVLYRTVLCCAVLCCAVLCCAVLCCAVQGPWEQRQIPNPAYFKVDNPLDLLPPVAAVAFELWTTEPGYTFDSVLLGSGDSGIAAAAAYMRDIWRPRNHAEVRGGGGGVLGGGGGGLLRSHWCGVTHI